jgi:hypothetical protein
MLLNPFATDAYNVVALVDALKILPNNYGRLRELKLFPDKGVRTRTILIERANDVLNILTTMPVGSPGQKLNRGLRDIRAFVIPHIPAEDVILPSEYDSVRAFGTEDTTDTVAAIMNDHLQAAKNKFLITFEYFQMGALKGVVYDADGSTIIYDWYKEFLYTRKEVDFVLGTSTTNIKAKCLEVKRHIELNLQGEIMTGIRVLVDKDFMDAFTEHAVVKTAYERWRDGEVFRSDTRKGFDFCGLTFEEYEGTCTTFSGVARKFLASKDGVAFPEGTQTTFANYNAPADFMETVNTMGLPLYAKQEERKFGRGIDLHLQANPLPICKRPNICVRVFTSTV